MTEQFNDIGSLYVLENQQWKKVGNGTLILMTNIHNPSHIIVKIIDKNGNNSSCNTGQVFQCKPKTKPKGNKSYILKGTDTKTSTEFILAARFKSQDTATCFKIAVENAADLVLNNTNKKKQRTLTLESTTSNDNNHHRGSTMAPDEIRKQFATKEWVCKLCTSHNTAEAMQCKVCLSPRLIMFKSQKSTSMDEDSITMSNDSISLSPRINAEQIIPPKLAKMSELDVNSAAISVIYGDGGHTPTSPQINSGGFDWGSVDANDKISDKPSPDGGDIDSTKKDFIRILTTIESNITHQDPLKLFDDLAKVAKRLMRKDPKYRTLDLKNPVVQERLMKIDGVDAYLTYLGFEEEATKNKLICPDDQPPRSVIKTAQEVCGDFLNEWEKKQHIFDLLSESRKDVINNKNKVLKDKVLNINININTDINEKKEKEKEKGKEEKEEKEEEKKDESEEDGEQYTLRQLVWTITHESSRDENKTADVLLLCHSVFAESIDLLALLIERFNGKEDNNNKEDKDNDNNKNKDDTHWNIQIKVGSMLSSWMKTFWDQDFEENVCLMEEIESFFESVEIKFNGNKRVQVLLSKMRGIYNMQCNKNRLQRQIKHKDVINSMIGKPKNFNITDQKAVKLAEQFTLMHFTAFKAITKRECLGQSWKKKDGSSKNVLSMIKLFNETAKWVQILILTQPNLNKRAKVMKLCISIATYMKNFRNFSGSCAFHSALSSTPIYRLKIAWSKISASDIKKFKELTKIFGFNNNNWRLLRKLHRSAHAPAILHTGLFLQDLVGIDEGQSSHDKNGKVNFKKLIKINEKIDTIAMYQQEEYQFNQDLFIQTVINQDFKAQKHIDSDFLFKISSSVKASDQKKK